MPKYDSEKISNHINKLFDRGLLLTEEYNYMLNCLNEGKIYNVSKFFSILTRLKIDIDELIIDDGIETKTEKISQEEIPQEEILQEEIPQEEIPQKNIPSVEEIKEPKLIIPRIEEQKIFIENNNYKQYLEEQSEKMNKDLQAYWKFNFKDLEDIDFDSFDIKKYGKDKIYIRELFLKKNLCQNCLNVLHNFIQENEYIKNKYFELMGIDFYADVFNRNDINFNLVSESKKIINADDITILILKYVFAIRYTFKESLYKIFCTHTKSQIDYIIKRLEFNKLISTKRDNTKKTTIIIPTNVLDSIILKNDKGAKNKISEFEFIKSMSKNNYVVSKIEKANVKNINDIENVLKSLPEPLLYKGADRSILKLKDTDTRYKLEYYYLKLQDIKNSLKCLITQNRKKKDENIQKELDKLFIPLYDTLEYLLKECYTSTASFGRFKEYASFSIRSLAENGVYIYDIKINKDNEQTFRILTLQTLEDFRTSKFVYKIRDCIVYMCSNNFENNQKCLSNEIYFYDEYTRQKFLKKIKSIKDRIKDEKTYYMFDCRVNLSKYLASSLFF